MMLRIRFDLGKTFDRLKDKIQNDALLCLTDELWGVFLFVTRKSSIL